MFLNFQISPSLISLRPSFGAATAVLLLCVSNAGAQVTIFEETFDSPVGVDGNVFFQVDAVYDGIAGDATGASFEGNAFGNGLVVNTADFLSAEGGSGVFLFHNTAGAAYTGNDLVWGSLNAITVVPDTDYILSFSLANIDNISNASIIPSINGGVLSSAVTAVGAGAWTSFSVNWNSGSSTTASLALRNQTATGTGNDFGIDSISLAQVPEPSALLFLGGTAALGLLRRRRAA